MGLEETKKAISLAMKTRGGHRQTEETKVKISEAHKGKVLSQEIKDKISLTSKNRTVFFLFFFIIIKKMFTSPTDRNYKGGCAAPLHATPAGIKYN